MSSDTTSGGRLSEQELCPDELLSGQEAAFARDIDRLKSRRAEFVDVACPACGRGDASPAFEKFTFLYVRCRRCRTIYMTPRPSVSVMSSYYSASENYQYWAEHIFPASEAARREKLHKPWLERVVGYCERYGIDRGSLLEVGAGFGTFSAVAMESKKFREVRAIEPTPEMAAACRACGVSVLEKRIEDADLPPASVDVVAAFEVIEHLFEPRVFLTQCRRVLRPGGLLVLSCPNAEGFDIAQLGPASLAIDPEHVNLFNPSALSLLVSETRFEMLEATTPGRLDAEFVHAAIVDGRVEQPRDPFLRRVLVDEWDRLGWPFQQFLADNGLSSHMWLAARAA